MKRTEERERERQEHLRRKEEAHILLAVFVVLSTALLGVFLFCVWYTYVVIRMPATGVYYSMDISKRDALCICSGVTLVITILLWFSARRLPRQVREVVRIHSRPLIDVSDLPAEEVLVRGAEEPSAPQETLLRATVKDEETKAEELLRVASGATGSHEEEGNYGFGGSVASSPRSFIRSVKAGTHDR